MYVYKSVAEYKVFRWRHKAALWSREGRPLFRRVSRCVRSFSVYPFSSAKANVSHLCEKLKNALKSDLEQRCDGNFWAIFAGMVLGEKPNFTGKFFEQCGPFENITR